MQLVDTGTGAQLWADRFETDRANLMRAQAEITGRLAQTLHVELVEAASRRIEQENTVHSDARDLVMRGLALYYRPSSAATREEAQRAFEQALEIDPRSVDARDFGLAVILTTRLGTESRPSPAQQDEARAERLLVEALERDANRSMAHEVMGMLRRTPEQTYRSRIEFETAVALDRNDAHAWLGLGQTLMFLGLPEAGVADIEKAMRLDSLNPNAAFSYWALGTCHLLLGHLGEASDLLRGRARKTLGCTFFHLYLAGLLRLGDDLEEAKAVLAEAFKLKPEVNSLARGVITSLGLAILSIGRFERRPSMSACVALACPTNDRGWRPNGSPHPFPRAAGRGELTQCILYGDWIEKPWRATLRVLEYARLMRKFLWPSGRGIPIVSWRDCPVKYVCYPQTSTTLATISPTKQK